MKRVTADVTSTAKLLHSPGGGSEHVEVINNGPHVLYLGPSGVSTSNGLEMPPHSRVELHRPHNAVYAVTASGQTSKAVVAVNVS